jgi:hypothetical protein
MGGIHNLLAAVTAVSMIALPVVANAEYYADEYIKLSTDHTNWAQNLYIGAFPKKDHTTDT